MSSDVIIGHDGKPRCAWAGAGDTAFGRYHDEVWGTRTYDESAMFEALTLGVFEVGLSWSIVFGKRDAFRKAFRGFDVQDRGDDRAREVLRDHPQGGTAIHRRPTQVDPADGGVREAVEVAGVPLRGAYECVRVHAERRRGQRPHPWVLPRDRLPRHGPEPWMLAIRLREWKWHGSTTPLTWHRRSRHLDGAFMEQSGRNPRQSVANQLAPITAQPNQSATAGNPSQ